MFPSVQNIVCKEADPESICIAKTELAAAVEPTVAQGGWGGVVGRSFVSSPIHLLTHTVWSGRFLRLLFKIPFFFFGC